jgi:hypothetical protein
MGRSSFDNVSSYLSRRRARTAVPAEMQEDVETVVRRCERLRSLGEAFQQVELSPYMRSLLRVPETPVRQEATARAAALAGC